MNQTALGETADAATLSLCLENLSMNLVIFLKQNRALKVSFVPASEMVGKKVLLMKPHGLGLILRTSTVGGENRLPQLPSEGRRHAMG